MIPFVSVMIRLVRALTYSWRDPELRGLLGLAAVILLSGTLFYRQVEGWSSLDSLPFSVVTLTTVGYGDLSPATSAGEIFAIFYILTGIGVPLSFVNKVDERPSRRPGEAKNRPAEK